MIKNVILIFILQVFLIHFAYRTGPERALVEIQQTERIDNKLSALVILNNNFYRIPIVARDLKWIELKRYPVIVYRKLWGIEFIPGKKYKVTKIGG